MAALIGKQASPVTRAVIFRRTTTFHQAGPSDSWTLSEKQPCRQAPSRYLGVPRAADGARQMTPLYQNDEALRAAIAPHLSRAAFARVIGELERYGFPKADPLFKARYAPAVRAWLDAQAGLSDIEPQVQDGQETWDDGGEKPDARADSAEAEIRPRSALLERRQRVAESEGLSRPLDPFTRRRHG